MNSPDHIYFESLETIFGLKILKFFYADPDPEIFWPWIRDGKIRIRDKHPGSATLPINLFANLGLNMVVKIRILTQETKRRVIKIQRSSQILRVRYGTIQIASGWDGGSIPEGLNELQWTFPVLPCRQRDQSSPSFQPSPLKEWLNPLDLTLLEHSLPQSSHTAMAEWSSRTWREYSASDFSSVLQVEHVRGTSTPCTTEKMRT